MADREAEGYRRVGEVASGPTHHLVRAVREHDGRAVVIKTLRSKLPDPRAVAGLLNEHELLTACAGPGVVEAVELRWSAGLPQLVLADAGPASLIDLLGAGGMPLARFWPLARELAGVLARVHAQGVLHRDINPANFALSDDGNTATLVDFGLATRVARVQATPEEAMVLAGTLEYISPEQTGRTGLPVDQRSDLYSLGATYFALLTGRPPFTADDPRELVHRHLAIPAPDLGESRPDAPPGLVALVARLLRKAPQERYQSAEGVAHDLRRLAADPTLSPTRLGEADRPPDLVIPHAIIGRRRESEGLAAALRLASDGAPGLVIVRGAAGIGKSVLCRRLEAPTLARGGYFATAKFGQVVLNRPHHVWETLFEALVDSAEVRGSAEVERWRAAVARRVGGQEPLLAALVPGIAVALGVEPASDRSVSRSALQDAARAFLAGFGRPGAPVVLFLDDLQWMDPGSAELLEAIVTDPEASQLLVVAALRPEELTPDHTLRQLLPVAEQAGYAVHSVELGPLDEDASRRLVGEAMAQPPAVVAPLADELRRRSGGNPFHLLSFLRFLRQRGTLRREGRGGRWVWDPAELHRVGLSEDVVEQTLAELRGLGAATRRVLCVGAVIGARFSLLEVIHLSGLDAGEVGRALWPAAKAGLVEVDAQAATLPLNQLDRVPDLRGLEGTFRFVHDRVQEAALRQLTARERRGLHLGYARLLLARSDGDEFAAVDHYALAGDQLADPAEQLVAADRAARAGGRALTTSAFESAARYLEHALGWIRAAGTQWDRSLALRLHRDGAEASWLVGDQGRALDLLEAGFEFARTPTERCRLLQLRILLHQLAGENRAALAALEEGLAIYGEALPSHDLDSALARELELTESVRALRSEAELLTSQPMPAGRHRDVLGLLAVSLASAYFVEQRLCAVATARIVRYSLEHGPAPGTGFALTFYGVLVATALGRLAEGLAAGRVGVKLARQGTDAPELCRALHTYGSHLAHRGERLADTLPLLDEAHRVGVAGGEHAFASYALTGWVSAAVAAGLPLDRVAGQVERGLAFAERTRNHTARWLLATNQRAVACWQGDVPLAELREPALGPSAGAEDNTTACTRHVRALQSCYLLGDLAAAREEARAAQALLPFVLGLPVEAEFELFDGLCAAGLAAGAGDELAMGTVQARLAQLRARAAFAQSNHGHAVALLEGELHRLHGRYAGALLRYEAAAEHALAEGFVHLAAMAFELAGRAALAAGHRIAADAYLGQAERGWRLWGADALAQQACSAAPGAMAHAGVRTGSRLHAVAGTHQASTVGPGSEEGGVSTLDLRALLDVFEAIAGELELDGLLRTLLGAALELGGCRRAVLLLPDANEWVVAAERCVDSEFERLDEPLARSERVPRSVVSAVARTRSEVLLHDACRVGPFRADSWIQRRGTRSLLAVPAVRQRRLVAMVVVENELAPSAFAPRHVQLLGMLATQSAVAVENAALFERVRLESAERLSAERQLQQAQKMESVGRLASGVAHDFNNLLGVILGYSALLAEGDLGVERSAEAVHEIGRAAERGAKLTRRLLAFSRLAVAQPVDLDLRELVSGLARMLDRLLLDSVHLVVDAPDSPVPARADPALIEQALVNLVVNARDAMPGGGRVRVGFGRRTLAEAEAAELRVKAGAYAMIEVQDEGVGIAPAALPLLFEPFYTTKPVGEGTGLGLSTCLGIAQQNGGTVVVSSELGRGSTFALLLPEGQASAAAGEADLPTMPPPPPRTRLRVLLVEDDDVMRGLLVEALQREGFAVRSAPGGAEAMQRLREETPDVLLTDFTMPGMDGLELVREARQLAPGLPAALLSGLTESLGGEIPADLEPLTLLQKPIRPRALASALSALGDDGSSAP